MCNVLIFLRDYCNTIETLFISSCRFTQWTPRGVAVYCLYKMRRRLALNLLCFKQIRSRDFGEVFWKLGAWISWASCLLSSPSLPLAICRAPPLLATLLHMVLPTYWKCWLIVPQNAAEICSSPKQMAVFVDPLRHSCSPPYDIHTWVSHLHSPPAKCLALLFGWLLNQPSAPRERKAVFAVAFSCCRTSEIYLFLHAERGFLSVCIVRIEPASMCWRYM